VPEAGYGAQRGGLPRVVARHVIRLASRLVTNSVAARTEAVINAGAEADKISVIYHGVEPLPSGSFQARELIALTVGGVWHENLLRKGLLPFVQAAAYLPDVRFVVAGRWFDDSVEVLREAAGQNVELRGFVSDGALADLYARSSVYVQASMHEGFGLSVAEAMSAGCIPVVTRVGALPEVVGASGVFAHTNKPQDIAQAIKRAARMPASHRILARQRVLTDFTMQQRHHSLVHLINSLDTTTIKAISI
jgi:glycosyltransferase involved in cell wall biosynthesis